jgi:hypothetical protein
MLPNCHYLFCAVNIGVKASMRLTFVLETQDKDVFGNMLHEVTA